MAAAPLPVRHIVLIVFDTLRRDAVGCYGTPPPWGTISTPNLDAFAREAVRFDRAYPEALPTLCARRTLYTGLRTYPFHNGDFRHIKGDFVGIAPGWGPIPEEQTTLAEMYEGRGFRTGLISDLYHQFKPSKNFWRGFHQWTFIRGQEADAARSGPFPSQEEIDRWVPRALQELRGKATGLEQPGYGGHWFSSRILLNMRDRVREELWFNAQVMQEASRWVEQNLDASRLFLTVESFDPHEPWFVPEYYRKRHDADDGQEQVISPYAEMPQLDAALVKRTRANYAGLVEMCDRWFGHLIESLRATGVLDQALVVVTSDHGHSLWERRGYIGKRGYPSDPESYEVPLLVRHPQKLGAGTVCDAFVQHHDISATLLEASGVAPPAAIDGKSFWRTAFRGDAPIRDHVTIGWGSAMTVIDDQWWLNCKIDGRGPFLYDSPRPKPDAPNLAEARPDVVQRLFALGKADAGGRFPEYLQLQAQTAVDAPGCSPFAALR
ncbi:MAG TPA: sulfatase [Casimicrobiaceae bacterium]|nr:sulfatase [Casimicrobiaceae bacterium]